MKRLWLVRFVTMSAMYEGFGHAHETGITNPVWLVWIVLACLGLSVRIRAEVRQ